MGREVGIERNSPLMLGGFLLWAIFCPLLLRTLHALPTAAAQLLETVPSLPGELSPPRLSAQRALCCCDGIYKAAAVAAWLRAQLGSVGLGRAPAYLGSGLRCASSLTLTLLWTPWLRLLTLLCCSCCWRGAVQGPQSARQS